MGLSWPGQHRGPCALDPASRARVAAFRPFRGRQTSLDATRTVGLENRRPPAQRCLGPPAGLHLGLLAARHGWLSSIGPQGLDDESYPSRREGAVRAPLGSPLTPSSTRPPRVGVPVSANS